MKYPYLVLPGDPSSTPRPLVPVIFQNKSKQTQPILTLIDSGADYSFASLKLASYLGINFKGVKPTSISGFTDAHFECYPKETTIIVDDRVVTFPIFYGGDLTQEYQTILGQDFFFDKTKITFERYSWTFSIEWKNKSN